MMNFLFGGANMIIQHKKKKGNKGHGNQGGNGGWNQGGQNQGGWGGQNNNQWGGQNNNQGGWGNNNQGWGGEQQNQGWGQNQGGWGGQNGGNGLGTLNDQNQQFWGNNYSGQQWAEQQRKRNDFNVINPNQQNINIGQVITEQVTFIEPSPSQKKLEQLKRTGQPFIDESFPPNAASLSGEYGPQADWKTIKWQKVSSAIKNPVIFKDKPSPCDIKQGYLGDCYFLAGLAALAERPDRIFNLFLMQELNQQKYFSVKMLYKGKWMTVDMDQYVPWLNNQPAFSRAVENSLWVVLLQKAWAKLYTSYKRIEAGYPQEAIHDLTGAPIRQIVLTSSTFNKQQQWTYLLEASAKEYSMVASSLPGSDTQKSMKGVVQGHAYTVLNAVNLNVNGSIQRIVELRNPWGKGQWSGQYSDNDQSWNSVSQEEKQRIGFKPNDSDGLFWMPYDDFIKEFRSLTVAQIDDEASYVYKSTKDKDLNGVYFTIDILKEGVYSFHVDKTPERIYPEKYQEMFKYPEAIIEIGRIQGNSIKKFQGLRSSKRTLFKKENLTPGKYVAFVKVSYDRDFEDQFDVNLAVYAPTACNIQLATKQEAAIFSGNQNVNWTGQDKSSNQPWNSMGNVESGGNNNFDHGNQQQQGNWGNQQGGNGGWNGQQGESISYGNQQQQGGWGGQQQSGNGGGWDGQQGENISYGNQQQQGGWGQPQQGGWGGQGRGHHGGRGGRGGWGGQGNNGW